MNFTGYIIIFAISFLALFLTVPLVHEYGHKLVTIYYAKHSNMSHCKCFIHYRPFSGSRTYSEYYIFLAANANDKRFHPAIKNIAIAGYAFGFSYLTICLLIFIFFYFATQLPVLPCIYATVAFILGDLWQVFVAEVSDIKFYKNPSSYTYEQNKKPPV